LRVELISRRFMLISVIALVVLNVLLYHFPLELDFSHNKLNSISKETKSMLKKIKFDKSQNVEVVYFSAITNNEVDMVVLNRIKNVFKQFKKYSKNITYKIIDLESDTDLIREYESIDKKSIYIKKNNKSIVIPFESYTFKVDNELIVDVENVLVNELEKLVNEKNYDVYYVANHGDGVMYNEFSNFNYLLTSRGFDLKEINLETQSLDDVKILYIISPTTDFTESEIKKLTKFLDNGGNLFITLSSNIQGQEDEFLNLRNMCSNYGLNISSDIIVDQIQDTKLIGVYAQTEELKRVEAMNKIVYMPFSRKLGINSNNKKYTYSAIMTSGELSNNHKKGYPLIIEAKNNKSKILLSATDKLLDNNNITDNKVFVSYILNWINDFDVTDKIEPYIYKQYLTNPNKLKPSLVFGVIRIVIPCIVLYCGIEIRRRRNRN